MKVVAIIQARMGSTRLPGKVLKKILDKPMLAYQLERIAASKWIDQFLVATTVDEKDDPIISFCHSMDISYYRGSEQDVLERYYQAAVDVDADIIVRLTSDCPLVDPKQIDKVIQQYFLHYHPLLFVSNTVERTLPRGMDTEVFSFNVLKTAYNNTNSKADREHVTRYMLNHPRIFTLMNVSSEKDYSNHRWTVDTAEDFLLIEKILTTLYPENPLFTLEDTIQLLDKNPEWRLINSHIQQKENGR